MNLIDEEFQNKNANTSKALQKIIGGLIVIVIAIIITIVVYLYYVQSSYLSVEVDGVENNVLKQLLVFEEDGKIYLPIKEVSKVFGAVESYNGHYQERTEDSDKCYIKTEQEAINFTLGLSEIEKLNLEDSSENYQSIKVEDKVKEIDGVLYASSEVIAEALNLSFEYNQVDNKVEAYTLPYLVEAYSSWAISEGYSGISEEFENQKAIIDNKLVVIDKNGDQFGVIDLLENKIILEPKYENVTYLSDTTDYLIETNGRKGIVSETGGIKITSDHDEIEVLDYDAELYLVSKANRYGVMDFDGNIVMHIQYDEIGIDTKVFEQPEIKSGYLLVENIIPVYEDNKIALFDKTGKRLTEFKYDNLGYIAKSNEDEMSALIIPNFNMIIVEENGKYGLATALGEQIIAPVTEEIYMVVEEGKVNYYISANGETRDLEEYLSTSGIKPVEID